MTRLLNLMRHLHCTRNQKCRHIRKKTEACKECPDAQSKQTCIVADNERTPCQEGWDETSWLQLGYHYIVPRTPRWTFKTENWNQTLDCQATASSITPRRTSINGIPMGVLRIIARFYWLDIHRRGVCVCVCVIRKHTPAEKLSLIHI